MRVDPRTLCSADDEVVPWAVVHDLVAHPLLVLTLYSQLAVRFHDWTSRKAWPR